MTPKDPPLDLPRLGIIKRESASLRDWTLSVNEAEFGEHFMYSNLWRSCQQKCSACADRFRDGYSAHSSILN